MSNFPQTSLLLFVLLSLAYGDVFLPGSDAHSLLQRSRRANSGYFEELKKGDLERECMEEVCDYEEAREVFEDAAKTDHFWTEYVGSNPCQSNPCLNNGSCVFVGRTYQCLCPDGFEGKHCETGSNLCQSNPCLNNGSCVFVGRTYQCLCPDGFEGKHCETGMEDILQCLYLNGGCEHFCSSTESQYECKCAEGYALGQDGRKCLPTVQFPCGKMSLLEAPNVLCSYLGGRRKDKWHCPKGHCPWQVLLQLHEQSYCGGVMVRPEWVITAAHCLDNITVEALTVVAGEHDLSVEEGTEQRIPVAQAIVHEHYSAESSDSNIALLRLRHPVVLSPFAAPVCLPPKEFAETELAAVRFSTLSGWGSQVRPARARGVTAPRLRAASSVLRKLAVPLLPSPQCASRSGFNLSTNMLCAGYLKGSSVSGCWGDDGSPLVTWYGDTAFLTGFVGLSRPCSYQGYFKIYTKLSNFVDWLQGHMNTSLALTELRPLPTPTLPSAFKEQKKSV